MIPTKPLREEHIQQYREAQSLLRKHFIKHPDGPKVMSILLRLYGVFTPVKTTDPNVALHDSAVQSVVKEIIYAACKDEKEYERILMQHLIPNNRKPS